MAVEAGYRSSLDRRASNAQKGQLDGACLTFRWVLHRLNFTQYCVKVLFSLSNRLIYGCNGGVFQVLHFE